MPPDSIVARASERIVLYGAFETDSPSGASSAYRFFARETADDRHTFIPSAAAAPLIINNTISFAVSRDTGT